jgi:hypothetical protein
MTRDQLWLRIRTWVGPLGPPVGPPFGSPASHYEDLFAREKEAESFFESATDPAMADLLLDIATDPPPEPFDYANGLELVLAQGLSSIARRDPEAMVARLSRLWVSEPALRALIALTLQMRPLPAAIPWIERTLREEATLTEEERKDLEEALDEARSPSAGRP